MGGWSPGRNSWKNRTEGTKKASQAGIESAIPYDYTTSVRTSCTNKYDENANGWRRTRASLLAVLVDCIVVVSVL